MNRKFIPDNDHSFLSWVINFLKYLFQALARFGFPEEKYQELAAQRNDFAEKLETAEEPATRTTLTVQAKNDARKLLEANIRQAINQYLAYNPAVTDIDHEGLGIPIHSKSRHPAPVEKTFPWTKASTALIRHLSFDYGSSETSKTKPAGQHGMELASVISDTKPANIRELTHSHFDTHTPLVIEFEEEERGKTFWYAVRWENNNGEKGPWSEIMSVVIP
jgi:hypothetical protein